MKILLGVLYYEHAWAYGGPPRMVFGLARHLAARGHEVAVCTTDAKDEGERLPAGEERSGDVRVLRFRNLSNRLAFHGKIFIPLGMRRWLEENVASFDVLHLFDARTLQNAWAAEAAMAAGVPFFLSVWGSLPLGEGWKSWLKRAYDRLRLRRQLDHAAALLAQNDHEARLYGEFGADPRRVVIWPLAVDPEEHGAPPPRGALRRRLGIGEQEQVVLFVGRIHELKGLDPLLRAFAAARPRAPRARLVVVGRDDGQLAALHALRDRLGLGDRVLFPGPLYGPDALQAYVDCDLFAITPTHFEETSLASLSACACGRPILINDRCDVPWLAEHGAGRVVPHGVEPIAEALVELLSDEGRLRQMGEGARRMVEARFLWPRVVEQIEGLYGRARARAAP